jgi:hypothetical protein
MYATVISLTVSIGVAAAPVPKDEPTPVAKALVGTWKFASKDPGAIPPWGTGVATITADGKVAVSFGTREADKFFGNLAGTYRVSRDTLTTIITAKKGMPDESTRTDVLTITEIGATTLRMVYQNDEEKREIVLERVKSEEQPNSRLEK